MLKDFILKTLFTGAALWAGFFLAYYYDTYYLQWNIYIENQQEESVTLINRTQLRHLISSVRTNDEIKSHLRAQTIQFLRSEEFSWFTRTPYTNGNGIIQRQGATWFILTQDIEQKDDVSEFIQKFLDKGDWKYGYSIPKQEYLQWDNVFLFRNQKDLELLGYQVVSSRSRVNEDEAYRRHNVKQAFDSLGGVRVVNQGKLSFMSNINYDPYDKVHYSYGDAIIDWNIVRVYWWGICGASTALYQWLLTNKALSFEVNNHSKRYSSLYTATINDSDISTPGLDATVFRPTVDFGIENKQSYPIIVAMNFNGEEWSKEEVFSLGMPSDVWSFSYQKKYSSRWYSCYVWTINDEEKTSCYQTVQ